VTGEPMEIVLVRDRGTWADRMGELFSGRGHRVRQIRAPLGARAARRLFHALGPRGVVIVSRPRDLGSLARIPAGWRVVAVCRESRRPGSPAHRRIMRWARDADRFLAPTLEEADGWARDGLTNAAAMPDPLPVPDRCARLSDPVVVATGGPEHEYGLDLLLESWAELVPRHPSWRLSLPDCPASTVTYRHAEQLGVAETVEFGGSVVVGGRGLAAGPGRGGGGGGPGRSGPGWGGWRGEPRRGGGAGPGLAVHSGTGRWSGQGAGGESGDRDDTGRSGGSTGSGRFGGPTGGGRFGVGPSGGQGVDPAPPVRIGGAVDAPGAIRVGGGLGRPVSGPRGWAGGPAAGEGDGTPGGPPRHRVGGPADPLLGAAVFALPARTTGYPAALAAAMARGLPAVAYDCSPGVRELITDGVDGLIIPPGNTREFAAALEWLIMNEGIRRELARSARESARRFAPEAVADRWERLFSLLFR
jgi:glycosyltransferase involved in cell wall biosynthesis